MVSNTYSIMKPGHGRSSVRLDGMVGRMHEHHRVAVVERFQHRIEPRVAEEFLAIAREQADALVLELVERMLDLGDRLTARPTSERVRTRRSASASAR